MELSSWKLDFWPHFNLCRLQVGYFWTKSFRFQDEDDYDDEIFLTVTKEVHA